MWHQPIKPIHPPTNPQNYTLVCGFLSRGTPSVFLGLVTEPTIKCVDTVDCEDERFHHYSRQYMEWIQKLRTRVGLEIKTVRRSSREALYLLLVHILWFRRSPIQCDTPYDTPATLEPQIAEGALALNHPYNDVGTNPMVGTPVVD